MTDGAGRRVLSLGYYARFIKFNLVGLSGVAVNEGMLVALTNAGLFYLYSSAVAIEVSILTNFVLNDYWTFRDRRQGSALVRLVKFNLLMLVGLATNLAIVFVATSTFGIYYALSNLIGIAAAFLLRYALSVRYTWMRKVEDEAALERKA